MSNIKVTKADNFRTLLTLAEVVARPELVEFINHELELLAKKSTNRKPSKSKTISNTLRDIVLEVLNNAAAPMTIAEIQEVDDRLTVFNGEKISNQRVSAILTDLIAEDVVARTVMKRKNHYAIKGINDTVISAE